jgi:predicted AlkP superfamily pyrophosphatase or phosphodiesterase
MASVLPAVTCSAQATMLTGRLPSEHGIVGNGWMDRSSFEVALWRQSNALVDGEKVYETARRLDPSFTCAKLFWWWNMGAAVDWSITPRPHYPADGRKIPAIYSTPMDFAAETEAELGRFPFFDFWGPRAGLPSSEWITQATLRTLREKRPTLTLAYLPHLDYDFQRHGPDAPASRRALGEVDELVGRLIDGADSVGAEVVVVSEYGIQAVDRPVHINRALREAGLLTVRSTPTGEVLDPFASRAFSLSDHQVAHIYTRSSEDTALAAEILKALPGVDLTLGPQQKETLGLNHPRAGDIVAVAERGAWFTYYYWPEGAPSPDFARTVDIHRKPGYDPCEMFLDPALSFPKAHVAWRLLQKRLGMRTLLDVIPLDASLVRGSHGRLPDDPRDGPIFLCSRPFGEGSGCAGPDPGEHPLARTSVAKRIISLLDGSP